MAYFLFIDESGHDQKNSPHEVLAGLAIRDNEMWEFIQEIHCLEQEIFGMRISEGALELKGKKLLKSKTFRLANQEPPFDHDDRKKYAYACLLKGQSRNPSSRKELTALGQAKIAFVGEVLELCRLYQNHVFASIIDNSAPRPDKKNFLRKEYVYLLERFYYYLEDKSPDVPMGVVVFDELEKSQCHQLVKKMEKYFLETGKGYTRSSQIIPEPFFVHSDLSTIVQVADLIAYIVCWGFQVGSMPHPERPELKNLAKKIAQLQYHTTRQINGQKDFRVSSICKAW